MDKALGRHVTTLIWPLMIGGVAYAAAASRAQRAFAPMVFAGATAYAVRKAMDNDADLVRFGTPGLKPFGLGKGDWIPF